jgi:hypothetical protein
MRFGVVEVGEVVLTCRGMDLWAAPLPGGTYGFASDGDPFEKLRCRSAIFAAMPPSTLFFTTGDSPPLRGIVGEPELDDVERRRPGGEFPVATGDFGDLSIESGFVGAEKALNAPMFDLRWKNEAIGDLETDTGFASCTLAACSSSMRSSSISMDDADVLRFSPSGAAAAAA